MGGYFYFFLIFYGIIKLRNNMGEILNKILQNGLVIKVLNYVQDSEFLSKVYDLDSAEILIIVAIAAVLMVFIVYRWLGAIMVFVLLLAYLLIYTLYINDFFSVYESHEKSEQQHMQLIEEELKR